MEEEGDEASLPRTLNRNGICTFVFVYFHVRHPGTSFLRSSYNYFLKDIAYVMVYVWQEHEIKFYFLLKKANFSLMAPSDFSADTHPTWPHICASTDMNPHGH